MSVDIAIVWRDHPDFPRHSGGSQPELLEEAHGVTRVDDCFLVESGSAKRYIPFTSVHEIIVEPHRRTR